MLSAIHSALSGLAAFEKEIEVTAHNVANVNTNGFKKSRTEFVAVATGGVLPVVQKDDSAGPTVLNNTGYNPALVELSNVDLGEEPSIRPLHSVDLKRIFAPSIQRTICWEPFWI